MPTPDGGMQCHRHDIPLQSPLKTDDRLHGLSRWTESARLRDSRLLMGASSAIGRHTRMAATPSMQTSVPRGLPRCPSFALLNGAAVGRVSALLGLDPGE